MHLSEGVLHSSTLLVGAAVAIVGMAIGLKQLKSDRLSLTALFASAFFRGKYHPHSRRHR